RCCSIASARARRSPPAQPWPPQLTSPATGINFVNPTTCEDAYVESHPHRDYVMQWNLNVQREVIPNLTVVLGYVGSRGGHQLFRIDDANIVLPTLTSAGYLWPVSGGIQVNSVNTGAIRLVDGGGDSFSEG